MSFDIERFIFDNNAGVPNRNYGGDSPVYVTGLARSGTTIVLKILDKLGCFASLTYRDMPFVLSPNLWKLISQLDAKNSQFMERMHGDGIEISYDSPESFEEIFWSTFCELKTENSNIYNYKEASDEIIKYFYIYRKLVVKSKSRSNELTPIRYLSKNNNNLMRLQSLLLDKSAIVVLIYRNPIDTAQSLLRQHIHFTKTQKENPFILDYMNFLGHHEFGINHKPFSFAVKNMNPEFENLSINYWIDYWHSVYAQLISMQSNNIFFLHHDSMRLEPGETLRNLYSSIKVSSYDEKLYEKINHMPNDSKKIEAEVCNYTVRRALTTYDSILADKRNIFVSKRGGFNGF